MLRLDQQSWIDYPPPARTESPIQLIQGWYYILVGLWVAIGVGSLQSPVFPMQGLSQFWLARVIGILLALAGVGLVYASRQKASISFAIGAPIFLAVLIGLFEVVAMVNEALPTPFMLDTAMELGFLVWWAIAIYHGEELVRSKNEPVGGSSGQM
jgi:hypothetical protein